MWPKQGCPLDMDQSLQNCEPKQLFLSLKTWLFQAFVVVVESWDSGHVWWVGVSLSTIEESDGHKDILGL